MPKLHWEDFKPGAVAVYGPRLVTREEIVAFAAEFDPQPMHLDEAAASATLLGGLGASGWHTCCLLMRIIADGFILEFQLDGRAWHRGSALAQAAAAGHADPRARDSAGRRVLEEPAGNGLDEFRYEVLDEAGSVPADHGHDRDAGPPHAGSAAVKYFEDIRVGDVFEYGRHTFTADKIKAFAARFDPQPFHVDEAAARALAFRRAGRLRLAYRGWPGCG